MSEGADFDYTSQADVEDSHGVRAILQQPPPPPSPLQGEGKRLPILIQQSTEIPPELSDT